MQNKLLILGFAVATFGILWFMNWAFAVRFDDDEYKQIFWSFFALLSAGGATLLANNVITPKH